MAKGITKEAVLDSIMLTPSCGCGTLPQGHAEKVLDLNIRLSHRLKEIYGR
ncbi:MAG: hypothetical protein ABH875_02910 [Candidatus Omnitrophota bacterium]